MEAWNKPCYYSNYLMKYTIKFILKIFYVRNLLLLLQIMHNDLLFAKIFLFKLLTYMSLYFLQNDHNRANYSNSWNQVVELPIIITINLDFIEKLIFLKCRMFTKLRRPWRIKFRIWKLIEEKRPEKNIHNLS